MANVIAMIGRIATTKASFAWAGCISWILSEETLLLEKLNNACFFKRSLLDGTLLSAFDSLG
jgi:hypothetical protein